MFENIFSSSPTVWTALIAGLVLLPILIHLINLLRHKRVKWAAMEFLLKSHKRNRNWVRFKQMLLLASRITILLLILFMLGQVGCNDPRLANLLGGKVTHHYVLIDDSFSMSDSAAGASGLDHARETLSYIAARAKNRENQRFTLLRFSKAAQLPDDFSLAVAGADPLQHAQSMVNPVVDLNARLVDSRFDQDIDQVRGNLTVSSLACDPVPALRLTRQLIESRAAEKPIVYVLSDFRQKDWLDSATASQLIEQLGASGSRIELVNCIKTPRPNLAITSLRADGNIQVAGVPLMMEIEIKNFGQMPARKVQIELTSALFPLATLNSDPSTVQPETESLPTILIDEIPASNSEIRRFPVYFRQPGKHAVKATLQHDAVQIDNACWSVNDFATSAKVLIVTGHNQQDARFVSLALSPNQMTGIQPVFGSKATLRDAKSEELDEYESIFLLDVDRLDQTAVRKLNEYVNRGGGIVFFAGPNTNIKFYNEEMFGDGNGIYPLQLDKAVGVAEQLEQPVPDIAAQNHPVFAPMLGVQNSPLDLVQISQVMRPAPQWQLRQSTDKDIEIAATVRGDARLPLVVDKRIGLGRSIAVLTSAGPEWNNWSRNGTFPAILLLMHEHVSSGRNVQRRELVGQSMNIEYSIDEFRPEITFVSPAHNTNTPDNDQWNGRIVWQVDAEPASSMSPTHMRGQFGYSGETNQPGIYETWRQTNQSTVDVLRTALNVDTSESDLTIANRQALLNTMAKAKPKMVDWDEFQPETIRNRGTTLAKLLLLILLVALVTEQILAWSSSYHPSPVRATKTDLAGPSTPSQQQAA